MCENTFSVSLSFFSGADTSESSLQKFPTCSGIKYGFLIRRPKKKNSGARKYFRSRCGHLRISTPEISEFFRNTISECMGYCIRLRKMPLNSKPLCAMHYMRCPEQLPSIYFVDVGRLPCSQSLSASVRAQRECERITRRGDDFPSTTV